MNERLASDGKMPIDSCQAFLGEIAGHSLKSAVLYVDIVGSTKLSIYLSQAELAFVIKLFWGEMSGVVARNNGLVFKYVGDAVIALFPDDKGCECAIDCAREMIRMIEQHVNPRLLSIGIPTISVKVGIDYGDSLVISYDEGERDHIDLVGFPLGMTAKITAMAKPSGILVGQSVVDNVESSCVKNRYWFSIFHVASWNFLELTKRDLVYRIYSIGDKAARQNNEQLMAG